jgi:putative hydrolase of HD superfamily
MASKKDNHLDPIVDFLFEVGILAKTPRSGFYFLGSGEQSVAEHINRVLFIGFVLASMRKDVDSDKVLKMCLFHDLAESRTSDLNHLHQKYAFTQEDKVIDDVAARLPFGDEMKAVVEEYEERKSPEAILAKDADTLEFLLSLKEQQDTGNDRAKAWLAEAGKRLQTTEGKQLAKKIQSTDSDRWWFFSSEEAWWIAAGGKNRRPKS